MLEIDRRSTPGSILTLLYGFLYKRCEDIDSKLAGNGVCAKCISDIKETSQQIQDKLKDGDKYLVEVLNEKAETLMDLAENYCYEAGFRDGMKLAQAMLLPEDGSGANILPPLDEQD